MINRILTGALGLLCASMAHAQDAGDSAQPSLAAMNTLPDMVRFLSSQDLRDRYALSAPPANLHIVAPTYAGVPEGLELFFASYPDEVPAGLTIAVLAYNQSGSQYGGIYQCPPEVDPCQYDPARQRSLIADDDLWLYSSHRTDVRRLGRNNRYVDVYQVETDRNGRAEGEFSAISVAQTGELDQLCLAVKFYEKKFFGLSEADPVSLGTYCYSFPLQRTTTSFFEGTFGYIPDEATRQQLRADFEALIGTPLEVE